MTQLTIEARPTRTEAGLTREFRRLRAAMRRHLRRNELTIVGTLPLPPNVPVARLVDGMREVAQYTVCDHRTGADGFVARVDVVVADA